MIQKGAIFKTSVRNSALVTFYFYPFIFLNFFLVLLIGALKAPEKKCFLPLLHEAPLGKTSHVNTPFIWVLSLSLGVF